MLRKLFAVLLNLCAFTALAQGQSGVQTVGDVSFAVPEGWSYSAGPDFGAMVHKEGARFWLLSVYTSMPGSGNPDDDFKAAWKRVMQPVAGFERMPGYNPYDITHPLGYKGKYYDQPSANNTAYARLYALQAGKSCVPVVLISGDRGMLAGMYHMEAAIVGSVRQAPAKATPIQQNIQIAELAGQWNEGLAFSTEYYNRSTGQYAGSQQTFYSANYTVAANGRYTYKLGGMINNRPTTDEDSGVIELGGPFFTLQGQKYQHRYRFLYLVHALDGSTVLAYFPSGDLSQIDSSRDLKFWTRSK